MMRVSYCQPNLDPPLVLGFCQLLQVNKFSSKLGWVREVRNYGESFIYQVQSLMLATNSFQTTNTPFPGVIF